eukprot:g7767.t1
MRCLGVALNTAWCTNRQRVVFLARRNFSGGDPEINPKYWGVKLLGKRKFYDLGDTSVSRNGRAPRLYFNVDLELTTDSFGQKGYLLVIDGKAVLTSGLRLPFMIPSLRLAQAICIEFAGQGRSIDFHSMPLTSLAMFALDRTPNDRPRLLEELTENIELDNVLQRTERQTKAQRQMEGEEVKEQMKEILQQGAGRGKNLMADEMVASNIPGDLSLAGGSYKWMRDVDNKRLDELTKQHLDPLIDWFNQTYGLQLKPAYYKSLEDLGCFQRPEDLDKLQDMHQELDDWTLTGLTQLHTLTKSALIPWALYKGRLDTHSAFLAARVEEDSLGHTALQGVHGNATDVTADAMMIKSCRAFWTLLGEQPP